MNEETKRACSAITEELRRKGVPPRRMSLLHEMLEAVQRGDDGAADATISAFAMQGERNCTACFESTWADGRRCEACREELFELQDIEDPPEVLA